MSFRSFQLQPGEELRPGLIRIVTRIAKRSAALPDFRPGKAEEAIHEARILIKLFRALVWTASPALSPDALLRIRPHLRAAADCLADPRDAAVLAATLSKLAQKVSGPRRRDGYKLAAQTLARQLTAPGDAVARRKLAATSRHLERASHIFQRGAGKTARPWPSAAKRHRAAARSCLRARKRALSSGRPDDFHEWRKKAKRLLLQWRVVEIDPGRSTRKALARVDKLQAKLGAHHDLVVLEKHLRKNSFSTHGSGPARSVLRHLHRQKKALEKWLRAQDPLKT